MPPSLGRLCGYRFFFGGSIRAVRRAQPAGLGQARKQPGQTMFGSGLVPGFRAADCMLMYNARLGHWDLGGVSVTTGSSRTWPGSSKAERQPDRHKLLN
jgi:hypothetical protein